MRRGDEGEAIVLVLFSPWCHPATVVTSKFSRTTEEDREEKKEEEEERKMENRERVDRGRWCEEEARMKGGG